MMSELRDHERRRRLLAARPEVAARAAELRESRAYLVGRLSGVARGMWIGRAALPLLRTLLRRVRGD